MIDPSDNPMKVFREMVGEENLTNEQREGIAEAEAYCDELVDEPLPDEHDLGIAS